MGGKGGGTEIPQEIEDSANQLINIGNEQFELGLPLFQEGAEQGLNILEGGTGGLRPAILTELETGRSAGSSALVDLRESLTTSGVTGTELQSQLAEARQGIESEVAAIPAALKAPTLEAAAAEVFGLPQTGLSNISSGLTGASSSTIASDINGGFLGAAGGAATGAAAGFKAAGPYGALVGGLLGGAKGAK